MQVNVAWIVSNFILFMTTDSISTVKKTFFFLFSSSKMNLVMLINLSLSLFPFLQSWALEVFMKDDPRIKKSNV